MVFASKASLESSMENYPEGADNSSAPWNAPCTDRAEGFAIEQVCGDNLDLTTDTFGQFMQGMDETHHPLLVKDSALRGPITAGALLKLMFNGRNSDRMIAAATRELTARYLADPYTRRVIESELSSVAVS